MTVAAVFLFSTVLAGVPDDAGETARYAMTYQAAPDCPDESQLRADIDAHIHDRARARGARVEIVIQRDGRETAGEMTLDDRAGNHQRRSLRGRDCADVAHALAFLAGLAIDLAAPEEAPAPAPPTAQVSVPPPPPTPPTPPHRFAPAIRAAGELRGGLADAPRPVGQLGITVEDRALRWFAPAAAVAILSGGGGMTGDRGSAALWLLGGRLSLCPLRMALAGVELHPCAAGELGLVWARATSLVNPPSVRETWASVDATVSVRWPASGRVFGDIEGGAIFPLIPAHLHVRVPARPAFLRRAPRDRARRGRLQAIDFDRRGRRPQKMSDRSSEGRPIPAL